jgi:hypothetical protein
VAACPHYFADFTDVEIVERGKRAGCFAYAAEARILHHWREVDDEAYRRGEGRRKAAKQVHLLRKMAGYPDDYERIIT